MKKTDYKLMIEKIKDATDFRLLTWEKLDQDSDESFSCQIGKCKVEITSYYDSMIDNTTYVLYLYNGSGQLFQSLRYSDAEVESKYSSLADLYDEVRDSYYKISESEKNIMETLDSLTPF